MNEDIQQIKKFWVMVSAYYQRQLDSHVVQMYSEDCRNITIAELKSAFEQWRRSAKGTFMPMPMQLVNLIHPEPDLNAEANEVVSKIREAIKKFGYMQTQEARQFMGELAYQTVEGCGGLMAICESNDEPSKWAQVREQAKAKMIRAAQGRSDVVPGLGFSGNQDRLQISSQTHETASEHSVKLNSVVSDALKGKSLS